ncbi:membrane-bound transcriptional regulator LytR [Fictibacillus macauensis ZFHKF-1]|uniref:Polyisoprenyl-teichoic acid--peptidoglycan teichoic acid transferase TagU n=1 Tax=Fictibacillus macauensis ZFHKF-1 TaxID=1196324 RepID=I8IX01_9BACL|nr:LCP family protein [Fictibacillus macauensis]EIT83991.1 membrane-bound transcriptional regulator LytR [Fictibacillus macauensis ZFHKF-1]
MENSRTTRTKKKRRGLKIVLLILVVFLAIGAGGVYWVYSSLKDTASDMHDQTSWKGSDKRKEEVKTGSGQPFSALILGVDERQGDRGRSDTMVLVTVNPKNNKTTMMSIPRDTRTEIVGKNTTDKINHAYAFGGVKMAMKSVENLFDIPIDYFVKVNMESFQGIVNELGGVTVNNERLAFKYDGYDFPKGQLNLSGKEALAYTRMRKEDPEGDFGRNERQRQVITAIINKGANVSSITKLGGLLNVLGSNVKTNMSFDEMKDIQANYKDARKDIETIKVQGEGKKINNIYYLIIKEKEINAIKTKLKQQLELN